MDHGFMVFFTAESVKQNAGFIGGSSPNGAFSVAPAGPPKAPMILLVLN
jgi:hypothetical protein